MRTAATSSTRPTGSRAGGCLLRQRAAGPGVGGHCIPIDPAYFPWPVRQRGPSFRSGDFRGSPTFSLARRLMRSGTEWSWHGLNRNVPQVLDTRGALGCPVSHERNSRIEVSAWRSALCCGS
jgi:hypothetical protein